MKRKVLVLLAAVVSTVAASGVYGQFGFGPIKRPNIANIFHPVVGAGAAYERMDHEGNKSTMEMSIVGTEMIGTQQGYWMEVGHTGKNSQEPAYAKMLVTPADFAFHKMVFVMPGSDQPMEMDMDGTKGHRDTMNKDLDKWHSVGTDSRWERNLEWLCAREKQSECDRIWGGAQDAPPKVFAVEREDG